MANVVILGGGYGGTTIAGKLLEGERPPGTKLTLIDRMPFQGLKTEYYALAAGTVADAHIRLPFPKHPDLTLIHGTVRRIDPVHAVVELEEGDLISYDILIIALGCTDRYHGIPGAAEHTCSIQSFSSTRRTSQAIAELKPYATVSIVGGGLSGVELAAELRESRPDLNIRLFDRGASILSSFPERLRTYVREWFVEHHVEMISGASVSRVEADSIYNGDRRMDTDLTVWTAGIQPVEPVQRLDLAKDPQGRLRINEYHQLPDFPNVYVAGDCASLPFSPSAQAAEAQGKQIAQVIQAIWRQETPRLDRIKLKGVLGSLGKKSGFGVMGTRTVMIGRVPRLLKSGVLWMSKRHLG